jgi:hypothetical protein
MFGPGEPLTPLGNLIIGLAILGVGAVQLTAIVIQPKWWTRRRGLHISSFRGSSSRIPVSRVGGMAMGVFLCVFGAVSILNGYFGILPISRVFLTLFAAFALVVIDTIYDNNRHKRRHRRRSGEDGPR